MFRKKIIPLILMTTLIYIIMYRAVARAWRDWPMPEAQQKKGRKRQNLNIYIPMSLLII
jgi:hypothetical protein